MFRIKRLYSFVLGTFLPLLLATFSVCLFILLMQFLWRYVDDMVGKGVELKVLARLFFYAAIWSVPMALPISILLSSLMTFGNLGEHMELLAMKASGISLVRIMKPLIVLMIFISGIAFVFQNNILPGAQQKFYTIMFSLRTKSPELDIREGSFFKDIPGYNLFVRHKEKTGLLREVTIYDYLNGFDNVMVIVADSGRMKVSDDKNYLILTLYNGVSFQSRVKRNARFDQSQTPFLREKFKLREILIAHNSNFVMADESVMQNREISKNIPSLRSFIRSTKEENDSITETFRPAFLGQVYSSAFKQGQSYQKSSFSTDTLIVMNYETFYNDLANDQKIRIMDEAKTKTERLSNDFTLKRYPQSDNQRRIINHEIELQKKFTYSVACLLFFFIGAPLGAIIRKGGLGLPAVLSIFIFVLYYTIETFGLKLAKQGMWHVWQGMWLSSAVLAALGIFLTYKAVNDSTVMNIDVWKETLQRFIGKREIRNYIQKEVIMTPPDYPKSISLMNKWNEEINLYLEQKQKNPFYISFWRQDFQDKPLAQLLTSMDYWIEDLLNSNENLIIGKLMDYPVITPYRFAFLNRSPIRWSCAILLPIGITIYIFYLLKQKQINNDLQISMKVNEEINKELINLKLV